MPDEILHWDEKILNAKMEQSLFILLGRMKEVNQTIKDNPKNLYILRFIILQNEFLSIYHKNSVSEEMLDMLRNSCKDFIDTCRKTRLFTV